MNFCINFRISYCKCAYKILSFLLVDLILNDLSGRRRVIEREEELKRRTATLIPIEASGCLMGTTDEIEKISITPLTDCLCLFVCVCAYKNLFCRSIGNFYLLTTHCFEYRQLLQKNNKNNKEKKILHEVKED